MSRMTSCVLFRKLQDGKGVETQQFWFSERLLCKFPTFSQMMSYRLVHIDRRFQLLILAHCIALKRKQSTTCPKTLVRTYSTHLYGIISQKTGISSAKNLCCHSSRSTVAEMKYTQFTTKILSTFLVAIIPVTRAVSLTIPDDMFGITQSFNVQLKQLIRRISSNSN